METKKPISQESVPLKAGIAKKLKEAGKTAGEIAAILGRSKRQVKRYYLEKLNERIPPDIAEQAETWVKEFLESERPTISAEDKQLDIIAFCERSDMLNFKPLPMQVLILKAFFSLPLTKTEKQDLEKLVAAGKSTWEKGQKYRELVIVAGMKGGKTTMVSLIACYEAYLLLCLMDRDDPWEEWGFPKGTEVYIINVATSKEQAEDTIYAQTLARIKNSPFFEKRYAARSKTINFEGTGIKIRCGHSNSASIVGKLAICVEADELARFKYEGGKNSAEDVYTSLSRSVEPFGLDGKIISISSPLNEKDKIMRLYKKSKKIPNMLGFKLATWEMNPRITQEKLKWELAKNPDGYRRDFGADPSKPKQGYYRIPSKIEEAFERAKAVGVAPAINGEGQLRADFKPIPDVDYYLHGDPAAKNDAFGLALGHREVEKPWLDLAHAFEAGEGEVDIEEIKNLILELVSRGFQIKKATFDTWAAMSVTQALKGKGITVENLYVLKEQHDALKQAIYQSNLEGQFPAKLRGELKQLLLLQGKKVDHPFGGSKDVADAAAAVVWHCMKEEVGVGPANAGKDPSSEDNPFAGLREKLNVEHRLIEGLTGRKPTWQ